MSHYNPMYGIQDIPSGSKWGGGGVGVVRMGGVVVRMSVVG